MAALAPRETASSRASALREHLDPTPGSIGVKEENLAGVRDPGFLALGLGGTNMMAMLWSIAMGKRAVGVELRGDPALGIHWNIREDLWHHLGLIDALMEQRYGVDRLPRRGDGKIFRLAETFYSAQTKGGAYYSDEVISGFLESFGEHGHAAGRIYHTEFIDDRWKDGGPCRSVTIVEPPKPPDQPHTETIGRPVAEVLDGPSTFQIGASEALVLLRRYLEYMEEMDLEAGVEPRVRLFLTHRVVAGEPGESSYIKWFRREDGFIGLPDGRKQVRIEQVRELDHRGKFRRQRTPGTQVIDIGTPELFMIAQGFSSDDADRLGFRQDDVKVDHHDGHGPVVAQADYLAGLMEINVGGRLRRRIASEFDRDGNEYWVRQIAVGHEEDAEVGWILVQVPDFKTFDPVLAGLVPEGTGRKSKEYLGAHQQLLREYYLEQVAMITEIPLAELEEVEIPYGPKLFSLVERIGPDPRVAGNGVVAGDTFGNGHFMTSGGAMTGMVGHAHRVLRYWQGREEGMSTEDAILRLAAEIKEDTLGWLQVSSQEFSQAVPINFGQERISAIERSTGRSSAQRANAIDATRRHRHSLVPLNPSDWRRLVVHPGKLYTNDLPPLSDVHPALRDNTPADPAPVAAPEPERVLVGEQV
ncbi:FHA domain-containing protein [Actinokineospora pegani]|uniref:FHA domain-containing protein n=1 Tax=Actinokineospora pegani TaxID=2654637 RepID=UPI0012EA3E58|nr:FHA domain-containing protein [Actinokineospora pegani]